jgi:hypothetical protein
LIGVFERHRFNPAGAYELLHADVDTVPIGSVVANKNLNRNQGPPGKSPHFIVAFE